MHKGVVHTMPAAPRKRSIGGKFAAVASQRGKIRVREGALYLIRPFRVARNLKKLLAEAHPCRRNARFLETRIRQVLLARAMKPRFARSAPSREIDLLADYVFACFHSRFDKILATGHRRIFQKPLIAAHHFIRLEPVVLHNITAIVLRAAAVGDRNAFKREIQKPRAGCGFRHALYNI